MLCPRLAWPTPRTSFHQGYCSSFKPAMAHTPSWLSCLQVLQLGLTSPTPDSAHTHASKCYCRDWFISLSALVLAFPRGSYSLVGKLPKFHYLQGLPQAPYLTCANTCMALLGLVFPQFQTFYVPIGATAWSSIDSSNLSYHKSQ